jgi:hypothetical protein
MDSLSQLQFHSARALNLLLSLGDLACQGSGVDVAANVQPAPGNEQLARLGRVLQQLLPSLGRQCVGVCIASHLSEVCGELLAALIDACSTGNTRAAAASTSSSVTTAAAQRQPVYGHVNRAEEQCQSSAAHTQTATGVTTTEHNTPAAPTRKLGDYIDDSLEQLTSANAALAQILHMMQGDLQPWMGSALGGHISRSYDSQQLCICMVPMLSCSVSQFPAFDASTEKQLSVLLTSAMVALPSMILAFKAAQTQPASRARGLPQVACGSSSSSSSSSSSRKARAKEAAGSLKGLRARLWEALSENTSFLQLLAMGAQGMPDDPSTMCLQLMLEAATEHVAPSGVVSQLNTSVSPAAVALLKGEDASAALTELSKGMMSLMQVGV